MEPVSRICRYDLIFGEILKKTEKSHPDYENLEKAYNAMRVILTNINKKIDDYKKQGKIFELSRLFDKAAKIKIMSDNKRLFIDEFNLFLPHTTSFSKKA